MDGLSETFQAFGGKLKKFGDTLEGGIRSAATNIGLGAQFEAAENARKEAEKNIAKANRDIAKRMRMAKKALEFLDEDDSLDSSDYDLLLSAPGATEKSIGVRDKYDQVFAIPAGSAFVWKARVKKDEIGFSIKEIKDQQSATEIVESSRYRSNMLISGRLPPSSNARTICISFDNSQAHLSAAKIVYWAACGENVTLDDDSVGAARSKEVKAAEEGPIELPDEFL